MKRVFYFVATNLAILLLLGVVLGFFGLGFLGYKAATLELVLGFLASLIVMWFSRPWPPGETEAHPPIQRNIHL